MNIFLLRELIVTCFFFMFFCFSLLSAPVQKWDKKAKHTSREQVEEKSPLKKYEEVITAGAETQKGLFTVHKVIDNYYFELPVGILEKEILIVSRMSKIPHKSSAYGAGTYTRFVEHQVVRFQRNGNSILMRLVAYKDVADEKLPVYEAVKKNNFEAIVYCFTIETLGNGGGAYVINVTDFFTSDVPLIGVKNSDLGITSLDKSRSLISSIKAYPRNVEIRHILTYRVSKLPYEDRSNSLSFEMNQSMVLLPESPMIPRLLDERVSYLSTKQDDYGLDEQKTTEIAYILRWRLEPSDWQAFNRGELVEPVKPIIYYIDPATPLKWKTYIKQGVEDWQEAFEEIGFKNAIVVKDPPNHKENPKWDIDDFQYSVIRFVANKASLAAGFTVHDPRSGEILKADIQYGLNHLNYIKKLFFIQTAGANPDAHWINFKDEVMGELIRSVIAHEVGHTLGLDHIFAASRAYPVNSLRSPSFTASNGNSASIMDYAWGNYVAQPEDSIQNFYAQIGAYDHWLIKYGYQPIPEITCPKQEEEVLNQWIREAAHNPFVSFKQGMEGFMDLGDDPIRASEYGIENLKRVMQNLVQWTYGEDKNHENLTELYQETFEQFEKYIEPVQLMVGGYYINKTPHRDDPFYQPVSHDRQKKAVDFLNRHLFQSPIWLMNREVFERVPGGIYGIKAPNLIIESQRSALHKLLRMGVLGIIQSESFIGENIYGISELYEDLRLGIFSELKNGERIDVFRRNLQKVFVNEVKKYVNTEQDLFKYTDATSIARANLVILKNDIETALSSQQDKMSRYHLQDVLGSIDRILNIN